MKFMNCIVQTVLNTHTKMIKMVNAPKIKYNLLRKKYYSEWVVSGHTYIAVVNHNTGKQSFVLKMGEELPKDTLFFNNESDYLKWWHLIGKNL